MFKRRSCVTLTYFILLICTRAPVNSSLPAKLTNFKTFQKKLRLLNSLKQKFTRFLTLISNNIVQNKILKI